MLRFGITHFSSIKLTKIEYQKFHLQASFFAWGNTIHSKIQLGEVYTDL